LRKDASSLSVGLTLARDGRSAWPDPWRDNAACAAHGGAFPVRMNGCGVVASIAVSGLPLREDHDDVVFARARPLGIADGPVTPG
jgi:uncharacterized protein (UPF0303 family)